MNLLNVHEFAERLVTLGTTGANAVGIWVETKIDPSSVQQTGRRVKFVGTKCLPAASRPKTTTTYRVPLLYQGVSIMISSTRR